MLLEPSLNRADSRQQLAHMERFRNIIVRSQVQCFDLFL
ncbi:Hypothetical protein DPCES_3859, partial [Desulfitobacterium hafniense]